MAEPIPARHDEPVVELDDERHADLDLSNLGRPQHRRYRAVPLDDGAILLRPELTDEELEARLLADSSIMAAIDGARANPDRLRPRPKRSQ